MPSVDLDKLACYLCLLMRSVAPDKMASDKVS